MKRYNKLVKGSRRPSAACLATLRVRIAGRRQSAIGLYKETEMWRGVLHTMHKENIERHSAPMLRKGD